MGYFAHETAQIEENAKIGDGTRIWNHSQIRRNATVGERCNIGKNVYIDEDVVIGSGVKIQNNVSVYFGVTVEDDVFIGPAVTFTNDMYPRSFNENWTVTDTIVRRGASIGANATVRCGITLGEYCMVGSGSVVTKSVPAYALVAGNPAKQIGWVCKCGQKVNKPGLCEKCRNK